VTARKVTIPADVPAWVTAGSFSTTFYPAGRTRRQRFHDLQRWRARRSAVVRRQLAKGKPAARRERTTPLALAHAYPNVRQLTAEQLEQAYRAWCERTGTPFDRRGFNTVAMVYRWAFTRYRACGQGYEFTNKDVMTYLAEHGRPRCERAVIYARRRLIAMGVFDNGWVKRGTWEKGRGWVPGEKADTVRMTMLHVRAPRRANCNLPTGAEASVLRPSAFRSSDSKEEVKVTATDSDPPPAAAENDGASAEQQQSTERGELERAITFQQMKLDANWEPARAGAELRRLRQALRLLDAPGGPESSGQVSDRIASSTDAGLM
jgi:hypothetical protein